MDDLTDSSKWSPNLKETVYDNHCLRGRTPLTQAAGENEKRLTITTTTTIINNKNKIIIIIINDKKKTLMSLTLKYLRAV